MENKNVLDEMNKGTTMGMEAVTDILEKVKGKDLKRLLKDMHKEYHTIEEKIQSIYSNYAEGDPHEINSMNKWMTDMGIDMRTMMDHSDSKLAELLLQGTNMGIIEGRRLLNQKEMDDEVKEILEEFVTLQEKNVEALKKYL